ncbi:hypothetical protein JOB18_036748 [Solea senegalensis]|uniref:Uncharacterized protein n=1 Tax=Solea senegalensis TaxID=28829 RepID=A0AAV6PN90_SOLSE|nr:hypothetical protein JOB18_036748 [Solea senegalensis]
MELLLTTNGTWRRITHWQGFDNTLICPHNTTQHYKEILDCAESSPPARYGLISSEWTITACTMFLKASLEDFGLNYTQVKWRIVLTATVASLSHLITEGENLL